MSLDVGTALSDAVDELLSERGALFVAVFVIFGLLNSVIGQSFTAALNQYLATALDVSEQALQQPGSTGATPLAISLPLAAVGLLILVSFVVGQALSVVAIRSFGSESADPLPSDATRNLLGTTVVAIAAGILSGIAIGIGFIFLIIPGLVLLVLFYFVQQEVALNDSGVIESIENSVSLVSDNAISVIILIVVLVALGFLITIPFTFLSLFPPLVSTLASAVLSQITTVFGLAAVTSAYQQAAADDTEIDGDDSEWDGDDDETVGTDLNDSSDWDDDTDERF